MSVENDGCTEGVMKIRAHQIECTDGEQNEKVDLLVHLVKNKFPNLCKTDKDDKITVYCNTDATCWSVAQSLNALRIESVTFTDSIFKDDEKRLAQWSMFLDCEVKVAMISMECTERTNLPFGKHHFLVGSTSQPNWFPSTLHILHRKKGYSDDVSIEAIVSRNDDIEFLSDLRAEMGAKNCEVPKWLENVVVENQRKRSQNVLSNTPTESDGEPEAKLLKRDENGKFYVPRHLIHLPTGDSSDEEEEQASDYESDEDLYWSLNC